MSIPTRKLSPSSVCTFFDRAKPIDNAVVADMRSRTRGRRRTRSPSVDMNRIPQP